MSEGDRAGWWAVAYLLFALFATWFTIACIVVWHIKEWFL
jgi:hypothetical protein